MKTKIIIVILLITLTACSSAQPSADVANTAMAIVQTSVALTQTAMPTVTPPPPTFTSTATVVYPTPSPLPTFVPPPILTPDAIQVERWKEYQTELAKIYLAEAYGTTVGALCEWDILGRSGQDIYVWAVCGLPGGGNGRGPTVIYLNVDGSVQNIKTAVYWVESGQEMSNENELFPSDVIEKLDLYGSDSFFWGRVREMINHLHFRQSNSKEPPLVVLLATPTP